MPKEQIIISLGGSLVAPHLPRQSPHMEAGEIDTTFLKMLLKSI